MSRVASDAVQLSHDKDIRATKPFLPCQSPHSLQSHIISVLYCSSPSTMARCREATPPPGVHRADMPGRWSGGDDGSDELDVFAAERYFNGDDAPWCALSSSSFSSAFRTWTTHEHHRSVAATATAATSSSEASWNSLSALLPDGKVLAASPSVVEAEPRGAGSERPRGKPLPPSSHLRRWLLGVAGCACVHGDGEVSVSSDGLGHDEGEDDDAAHVGEEELIDGAGELFGRTESKELAVVRARLGKSLDEFLAGKAAFSHVQIQLAGGGHRRSSNSATTAALLHGQRRKSFETLQPVGGILRSALASTNKTASTIVAGNTTRDVGGLHGGGGGGSLCDTSEDDAALSELGCAYPPSEASAVWSVVTAEGAASCNFSSAASGYYYHFNVGAARRSNWGRRRSVVCNGAGLLTCMGDKAVNAIEPARWPL
jgi:hypothetical protein